MKENAAHILVMMWRFICQSAGLFSFVSPLCCFFFEKKQTQRRIFERFLGQTTLIALSSVLDK
jgi:hypothetical protein